MAPTRSLRWLWSIASALATPAYIAFALALCTVPSAYAGNLSEFDGPKVFAQTDASNRADRPRFVLQRLELRGVSVYRAADLEALYASDVQREITDSRLYEFAEQLTQKYVRDGYVLSRVVVPGQEVRDGQVQLEAIEGFVSGVEYRGASERRQAQLQPYVDRIVQSKPLRGEVLERNVLLMNELPGVFIQPYFMPSETDPRASTLVLIVSETALGAYFSVDNRGSRSQGRELFTAAAIGNGIISSGGRTVAGYTGAFDKKELQSWFLTHSEHMGTEGGKLLLAFTRTKSTPGDAFAPLNLIGKSTGVNVTYSYPVLRLREESLVLRGTLGGLDAESDQSGFLAYKDRVRSLRLGAAYDIADGWNGVNQLDLELSQGLNLFGATRTGSAELSNAQGQSDYTKLVLFAARLQGIAPNWNLLLAATGQVARGPLLVSEQFSIGGTQFGRGYDPSELLGDSGVAGKIELRYTYSDVPAVIRGLTAYAFRDAGRVWRRAAEVLPKTESLGSAGLGLRLTGTRYWTGFIEVAKPLTRDVAGEGDRNARVYAGVAVSL